MDFHERIDALGAQFKGSWEDRLYRVMDSGVPYEGQTILDVGCNMGVVGYEVCKHRPLFYHGVEYLYEHYCVAHGLFKGVSVPSKIEFADITSWKHLPRRYDVVLYLAVHQHIKKVSGDRTAASVAAMLFRDCNALVFRGPDVSEMQDIAERHKFRVRRLFPRVEAHGHLYPLLSFVRDG